MKMQCSASDKCERNGRIGSRGMCYLHYEKFLRDQGSEGFQDPTRARAHLEKLVEAGMSYRRIGAIAGLSDYTVRSIPRRSHLKTDTARKILAVEPVFGSLPSESAGFAPALGSARRVRALVAMGYTFTDIAREIGMSDTWCKELAKGLRTRVLVPTSHRVDEVFQRLQLVNPPYSKGGLAAKRRAIRKGWALPLAWDEDTIDDPNAQPCVTVVNKDAWYEDYLELKELGKSDEQIAERLGYTSDTLKMKLWRRSKNATASSH